MIVQLHKDQTLVDAMAAVRADCPAVAIVDGASTLLGVVGDNEIRRALSAGAPPNAALHTVASKDFVFTLAGAPIERNLATGPAYSVARDTDGQLQDIRDHRLLQMTDATRLRHAVIMVGGAGERLKPLTDSIPKPMLPIGGVPILQRIVEHVVSHGIERITMALGYRGEQITGHFGDGAQFDVAIDYVKEEKPLGTAGALGMVERDAARSLLVMNGDILTDLNLCSMAAAHVAEGASLTVASRLHQQEIPFGVFNLMDGRVIAVEEKPTRSSWTNAGIYIMDPSVLELIPANQYTDMTLLIENLIRQGDVVQAFCLWESWVDIGRPGDYEQAEKDCS